MEADHTDYTIEVRPKDWLVPVALVTLEEQGSYGYELVDCLAELGFEQINPGTLYRTLRRMERKGLAETEWEMAPHGSASRAYSATDAGEAYLASWDEGCRHYQKVLDAFQLAYHAGRHQNGSVGSEEVS